MKKVNTNRTYIIKQKIAKFRRKSNVIVIVTAPKIGRWGDGDGGWEQIYVEKRRVSFM